MKKFLLSVPLALALLSNSSATNHFNSYSEASHFLTGMALGGLTTWAVGGIWPEHRALIGFAVVTASGAAVEATSKTGFSSQDVTFNTLGAAVGSWTTDRWLLAPVIRREPAGSFVGMVLYRSY